MLLYPSLLNRLSNQHEAIAHITGGVGSDRLVKTPAPGKWSIHDNIAHLTRYQGVFKQRIELIQDRDEPIFERYLAENDPAFDSWRKRSTADLLNTLHEEREKLYDGITCLSREKLEKTGIHPKFGRMNIVEWTEFFLLHEAHHIYTIFQLSYGKSET